MIAERMQVLTEPAARFVATATRTASLFPSVPTSVAPIPTVVPDKPEFQVSTETGVRTLWVLFVVMIISAAVFAGLSWSVPVQKRVFHVLLTIISVISALSYFAMATGHGTSLRHILINEPHDTVPDTKHEIFREVFFARYIDWSLTTPLILLNLAILAGLSGAHTIIILFSAFVTILTDLFAAYGRENSAQRWGWYTLGLIGYLVVVWHVLFQGRAVAARRSDAVANFYFSIATYTLILWLVYLVIWGVADGARKLSVDKEIIAYAVLDILAKPVFGAWLIFTHSRILDSQVDLGGFWTYGFRTDGQLRLDDEEGA